MSEPKVEIDKDLYSRQLYVLGEEAMKKMASSSVLVSGLGGLGVEIAKNITLAGIKSLTVNDHEKATWLDLSTNFYLTESHVKNGTNRAEACAPQLGELNPYTPVTSATHNLATVELSFFNSFKTVVLVNYPLEVQLRVSDYCHEKGIYYIGAESRGAFLVAFADFGEGFEVTDGNGEEPMTGAVADFSPDGLISMLPKVRHGLESGNAIKLLKVQGLKGIDESLAYRIKVLNPHQFSLILPPGHPALTGQFIPGSATWQEQKVPFKVNHISLRKSLYGNASQGNTLSGSSASTQSSSPHHGPDFSSTITDFTKLDANLVLVAIHATHKFIQQQSGSQTQSNESSGAQKDSAHLESLSRLSPLPWNATHASEIVAIAKDIASGNPNITWDEGLVRKIANTFHGQVVGLTAFLGGFLGQEVLKSLSGKFTPLSQWVEVDAREVIPEEGETKEEISGSSSASYSSANFIPIGHRSDGQAIVIGRDVCEALGRQKVFMIGSGAIGCEMLKNFAMMGIGIQPASVEGEEESRAGGKVFVTDNDLIEKSNLNRQFLFRQHNIGQPKSVAAAVAIKAMNGEMVVESHQHKVGADSESIYTNEFWRKLDLVVNALDNVAARLYVDSKCVENGRPLVESGTMGTKGHVQVIVPHLTANYGSTRDPPEAGIPLCTLKSFPSQIEHTIQWARDKWTTLFALKPEEIKSILKDLSGSKNEASSSAHADQSVSSLLQKIRSKKPSKKDFKHVLSLFQNIPQNFVDCLFQARRKFDTYYSHSILQLLHTFPLDHKNDDGTAFWALPRRPPTQLIYDPSNPDHLDFVIHSAFLYAKAYHIEVPKEASDRDWFKRVLLGEVKEMVIPTLPPFKLKENHHIETNEAVTKESAAAAKKEKEEDEQEQGKSSHSMDTDGNQASGGKASSSGAKPSSSDGNQSSVPHSSSESADAPQKASFNGWKDEQEFEDAVQQLGKALEAKTGIVPFADEFEKDNDANHHIDFITAASNLRASQYGIEKVDRMRTKFVAGKIIPAMATSTAAVTGLASLELIKLVKGEKKVEVYKNAWMNLALPSLMLSEPQSVEVTKIHDNLSISIWDRWEVDQGDLALGQFINHIKSKYKLVATALIQNTTLIYASILGGKRLLPQRLSSLLSRPSPSTPFVDLTVQFETLDGQEVKGPPVRFFFPHEDSDSDSDSDSSSDSE